jgi:hypothetical protein
MRNATGDGQDTGGNNRECRSKSAWWKVLRWRRHMAGDEETRKVSG